MNNYESKKLGVLLLSVSIIQLIATTFTLLACIFFIVVSLIDCTVSSTDSKLIAYSLSKPVCFSLFEIVGLILILRKKALGIYIYFIGILLYIIFSFIISKSVDLNILIIIKDLVRSLVLPMLTAVLIYRKRYIFKSHNKNTTD